MKLKYYDSTTRSLSFDEIRYFSIKDLWEISNDYEISSEIENGFYYDFDIDNPLSAEDLDKIEAEMNK